MEASGGGALEQETESESSGGGRVTEEGDEVRDSLCPSLPYKANGKVLMAKAEASAVNTHASCGL